MAAHAALYVATPCYATYNSRQYKGYAALETFGGGNGCGKVVVGDTSGDPVAVIGGVSNVYNSSGALVATYENLSPNTSYSAFTTLAPFYNLAGQNCYADGRMIVYDHDTRSYKSTWLNSTYDYTITSVGAEPLNLGAYQINSSGKSFGTTLNASTLGSPDLIYTIGINGVSGYMRKEDSISPGLSSLEASVTYYSEAGFRDVPIYATDGYTQVDIFRIYYGGIQS